MDIIKKSLKAYILCISLFLILTFVLTCIICFTPFKEEWSFKSLIAVLTAVTFVLGVLEGKIIGKKGFITGTVASFVFLIIILFSVSEAFSEGFDIADYGIFYVIPLISGTVGGIFGANNS